MRSAWVYSPFLGLPVVAAAWLLWDAVAGLYRGSRRLLGERRLARLSIGEQYMVRETGRTAYDWEAASGI